MLLKNALRTLKSRYLQLLLLGFIIILSSFIYTVFDYSVRGIIVPAEAFFEETNQEDFAIGLFDAPTQIDLDYITANCMGTFGGLSPSEWPYTISGIEKIDSVCYEGILNNRLQEIENVYPDLDLEIRESKSVYDTVGDASYHILFLKDMERINLSQIVEGTKPDAAGEIAISQKFAENNNLSIGDPFVINDKTYEITGFVLFPDYNLAVFSNQLIIDNRTQTFALVIDSEFVALDETTKFEVGGVYKNGFTDNDFRTQVIEGYGDHSTLQFISNASLTVNNIRSGGIYSDIEGGRAQGLIMSILISSIGLLIVGIMVSRVLHSQRGAIGILKSLGYTNFEIARPYVILIALMALTALAIGYYAGYLGATPMMNVFLEFYLLPSQAIEHYSWTIVIAIVLPFSFIVLLSYFIIKRLVGQKPVTLLNPEMSNSSGRSAVKAHKLFKKMKITGKIQQLLMYRSFVKLFVYLVGMFMASFLILLSFSMFGLYQRVLYDYYDKTGFNYIGYCDYVGTCEVPIGAEKVIEIPDVSANGEDLTLYGIDPDSQLIPLYNKKDQEITSLLSTGAIISESAHLVDGFEIGDTLDIRIGNISFSVVVKGISLEYADKRVYVDITSLSQTLTDTDNYFNSVYSADELNKDDYLVMIRIQDILDQSQAMNGFMNAVLYIMILISVVIGAIIIYILTVMTVEDNFYNISLFKVIGYNEREIDGMVLGGYELYGVLAFIVSIPVAILFFTALKKLFAQMFDMQFPLQFAWWHALVAIVIYAVLFHIGAASAKRNLKRISLQEAMKMYEI